MDDGRCEFTGSLNVQYNFHVSAVRTRLAFGLASGRGFIRVLFHDVQELAAPEPYIFPISRELNCSTDVWCGDMQCVAHAIAEYPEPV
jgi:hypothetical protein